MRKLPARLIVQKSLVTLFILLLAACSGYQGVSPGTIPPPILPPAEAQESARAVTNGFIAESGFTQLPASSAEHRKVARVASKLLKAAGYDPRIFPVAVVDAGEEVNAMVLNGSSIVVYKKLLDRTDEPEFAAVMAHEVGHLLAKHAELNEEEKSRAGDVSIVSSVLGTVASVATSAAGLGGLSDVAGSLTEGVTGAVGYGAYVGSFSRAQEYEADHIGLMLMAKAGYDPNDAIRLWSHADEVFQGSTSSVGAFFSTHPASGDRAETLQEYVPLAMQYYNPGR